MLIVELNNRVMSTLGRLLRVTLATALESELAAAEPVDWNQRMITCYHGSAVWFTYQECVQCEGLYYKRQ